MPQPTDPAAAVARFQRAAGRGDWPAAVASLDILLAHAPDDPALHYNRALALRLAGRPQGGLAAADRALALDPGHAKALFERGASALEAGEPAAALKASETFLARHPGDPDAAINAARAALLLGEPERAMAHLDGLAGVPATLARGEALRDLGRFDEAEAAWATLPASAAPLILSLRTKGARGRLRLSAA